MVIKIIFLALLAGFFFMQPCLAISTVKIEEGSQSVILDMQNMSCAMCKITIKKALKGVDGVQKVYVDFDSKTATVSFDPQKTDIEILIKATTNSGYPATVRPEK